MTRLPQLLAIGLLSSTLLSHGYFIDTHMHLHYAKESKGKQSGAKQIPPQLKERLQQMPPQRRKMMMEKFKQRQQSRQSQQQDGSEKLLELMSEYSVGKTVLVTVPDKNSKTYQFEQHLKIAKQYPDKIYVMAGGASLGSIIQKTKGTRGFSRINKKFKEKAKQLIEQGAIGFGEIIVTHLCMSPKHSYQSIQPNHPLMLSLSDVAAELNVPIDIHMEALPRTIRTPNNLLEACSKNPDTLEANIPALEKLLDHNKKTNFVWQHIGWDNVGYMTPELLDGLLAKHSNLYLSIRIEDRPTQVASRSPMPNRIVDSAHRIHDNWLALFEKYSDRIMVGGDEFIMSANSKGKFPTSFESTWKFVQNLPTNLRNKIGHDNAAKVYHL